MSTTIAHAQNTRRLGRVLESKADDPTLTPAVAEEYLRGAVAQYVAAGREFAALRLPRAASRCVDNAEACARRISRLHALPELPEFP